MSEMKNGLISYCQNFKYENFFNIKTTHHHDVFHSSQKIYPNTLQIQSVDMNIHQLFRFHLNPFLKQHAHIKRNIHFQFQENTDLPNMPRTL